MNEPNFDLATIEKWAYSTALDEEFTRHEEDEPERFDIAIREACPLKEMFRFAADPQCLKRHHFAQLLVPELCWVYGMGMDLPFNFSRLQGIMDKDSYLKSVTEHAEAVYERAEILEQMRVSCDPALQAFARALLDHRNVRRDSLWKENSELSRAIHANVLPLFADAFPADRAK